MPREGAGGRRYRRLRTTGPLLSALGLAAYLVPAQATSVSAGSGARAAQAIPAASLLQQRDLPGFVPIAPSILGYDTKSGLENGYSTSFMTCAKKAPLLDELPSGPDMRFSSVFGAGKGHSGLSQLGAPAAPMFAVLSASFSDGNSRDAQRAMATIGAPSFASCMARTNDQLEQQVGLTPTVGHSTVTKLALRTYGDRTVGFEIMTPESRGSGSPTIRIRLAVAAVEKGPLDVVLFALSQQRVFPATLLDGAIANLAARIGAVPTAPPVPQKSEGPCTPPRGSAPALTDAAVNADAGGGFTYAGAEAIPATPAQPVPTVLCTWNGPPVPQPNVYTKRRVITVTLATLPSFTGASSAVKAVAAQFEPAVVRIPVGNLAYLLPMQDDERQLLVVAGDHSAVVTVLGAVQWPGYWIAMIKLAVSVASGLGVASPGSLKCKPTITSVSVLHPGGQQLTIEGNCFGTAPGNTTSSRLLRIAGSHGGTGATDWVACLKNHEHGEATCTISSWTNSRLVVAISLGGCPVNAPGPPCTAQRPFELGEQVLIQLWNPLNGHGPASYSTTVAPGPAALDSKSYGAGARVAEEWDQRGGSGGNVWSLDCKAGWQQLCTQLDLGKGNSLFALGLLANLSPAGAARWAELIQPEWCRSVSCASLAGSGTDTVNVASIGVDEAAYVTGAVPRTVSIDLVDALFTASIVGGTFYSADFWHALTDHPDAATAFFDAWPAADITHYPQNAVYCPPKSCFSCPTKSYGSISPLQAAALSTIQYNFLGYADYPDYPGPLSPTQLGALMNQAVGNNSENCGRATVTNFIAPWMKEFGGVPDGSSTASIMLWVAPLVNLNGAIARPTAAYIVNAEEWQHAGILLASVAVGALASLGVGAVVDLTYGYFADRTIVAAGEATSAAVADANSARTALEALSAATASTDAKLASGVEVDSTKLLLAGLRLFDATRELWDTGRYVATGGGGSKVAAAYEENIMRTTLHEAIDRLIQEKLLLTSSGRVVPLNVDVNNVWTNTDQFVIKGGTPLSFLAGMIYSLFTGGH